MQNFESDYLAPSLERRFYEVEEERQWTHKSEWARLLVSCDRLIRREFISNEKEGGSSNNNAGLGHVEGQFISNEKESESSNNNAPLEGVIDVKTPLGGVNFSASSIYKNKQQEQQILLFKELKEKANNVVKKNQRSRNSTRCCDDKSPAKQGQPTVCEPSFSLEHNNQQTETSHRNNNGKRPSFTIVKNSFQIEGDAIQAIQEAMASMSDGLVYMAAAKQDKPSLELVPEPVKESLTPGPESTEEQPAKPKRGRKAKASGERKVRKSRSGQSGSFPPKHLIPFVFEGHPIRIEIGEDGEPWFIAKDVCDVLGIVNSRDAVSRLDDDQKADVVITDTSSNGVIQRRRVSAINESGINDLTLDSRKPEARRIRKWVVSDVIPIFPADIQPNYALGECMLRESCHIDAADALFSLP